mmetsp:Transcript_17150/g.54835  ORF Transcript_17150/g.54835 Transcript_17150/m.54835 type:complete len:119 (-) Transcript_17150:694-1050(-)
MSLERQGPAARVFGSTFEPEARDSNPGSQSGHGGEPHFALERTSSASIPRQRASLSTLQEVERSMGSVTRERPGHTNSNAGGPNEFTMDVLARRAASVTHGQGPRGPGPMPPLRPGGQ